MLGSSPPGTAPGRRRHPLDMACVWTGETAAGCWAGLDPRPEGHTLDVLFILGSMEGEQPGQGWVLQRPLRAGAGGPEGAQTAGQWYCGTKWLGQEGRGRRQECLGVNSVGLPEGGAKEEFWVTGLHPGWSRL